MALVTEPGLRDNIKKRRYYDPNAPTAAPVMTGLDKSINDTAMGLSYDVEAERSARTRQIEQQTQLTREKLGRQFGITPGGSTSGDTQRSFEILESGRIGQLDALSAELASKAPDQARQNIASKIGASSNFWNRDLSQNQLEESARTFDVTQLGRLDGEDTLAKTGQAFGEKVTTAGLTGTFDNAKTEQARNDALSRAIATGQQTGKFTDPDTNIVYDTQAALEQAFRQGATSAGLTGTMPLHNKDGTPSINPATGQQRMGTTLEAQRLGLETAQTFGKSGPIASGSQTEEARRSQAQESLQARGLNINEVNLASQIQVDQARAAGKTWDPEKEKWVQSVES